MEIIQEGLAHSSDVIAEDAKLSLFMCTCVCPCVCVCCVCVCVSVYVSVCECVSVILHKLWSFNETIIKADFEEKIFKTNGQKTIFNVCVFHEGS